MERKNTKRTKPESDVKKKVRETVARTAKGLYKLKGKLETNLKKSTSPLKERIKDVWQGLREGINEARKRK
ncbi:MAG: hypothetical protein NT145_04845 [Elusimicrobia bacterium]|nr:hypothetical protein [Elusimicrobiota bacterium]